MMVKVKLIKKHEDAGVEYEVGAEIEVDEVTAEWLVTHKVGEIVPDGKE